MSEPGTASSDGGYALRYWPAKRPSRSGTPSSATAHAPTPPLTESCIARTRSSPKGIPSETNKTKRHPGKLKRCTVLCSEGNHAMRGSPPSCPVAAPHPITSQNTFLRTNRLRTRITWPCQSEFGGGVRPYPMAYSCRNMHFTYFVFKILTKATWFCSLRTAPGIVSG